MDPRDLGEALPALVNRIVESYQQDRRTQHIDGEFLPSRTETVEVCELLLELTYPGFVGRKDLTRHNIAYHVGELLPRLWSRLMHQIEHCLCHDLETRGALPEDRSPLRARSAQIAREFLERIPDVRAMLALDVQAAYDGDPAASGSAEILLAYPGIYAITIQRYAHVLYGLEVPLMPRIMCEFAHMRTGIDIHPGAKIGRSFFIDHGTGVVIGETAQIGDNVKLYQSVTLGALSFPKDERGRVIRGTKRHPTVGNNVTVYANATVLGGRTTLGDGSAVGGSCFVTQSVEPGFLVSMTPPVLKMRAPAVPPKIADQPFEPTWDI
ncbi:MAG: serine acetyltransferase [Planctomycetia bacterium]|nr:MAG: serine acetyltransferase [Planctomycetia bacterium]